MGEVGHALGPFPYLEEGTGREIDSDDLGAADLTELGTPHVGGDFFALELIGLGRVVSVGGGGRVAFVQFDNVVDYQVGYYLLEFVVGGQDLPNVVDAGHNIDTREYPPRIVRRLLHPHHRLPRYEALILADERRGHLALVIVDVVVPHRRHVHCHRRSLFGGRRFRFGRRRRLLRRDFRGRRGGGYGGRRHRRGSRAGPVRRLLRRLGRQPRRTTRTLARLESRLLGLGDGAGRLGLGLGQRPPRPSQRLFGLGDGVLGGRERVGRGRLGQRHRVDRRGGGSLGGDGPLDGLDLGSVAGGEEGGGEAGRRGDGHSPGGGRLGQFLHGRGEDFLDCPHGPVLDDFGHGPGGREDGDLVGRRRSEGFGERLDLGTNPLPPRGGRTSAAAAAALLGVTVRRQPKSDAAADARRPR
mmetsp:Transcript_20464/g.59292  ORF Transcript_20464/g.59292 Transcript_20464/m.59292 type:complete len:413 (-) Transcript_20464:553-1791(-)